MVLFADLLGVVAAEYLAWRHWLRKADLRGLSRNIANGFRVEVCGIPGPRMRGTGALSFVYWKYPGIGATRRRALRPP
jgi:hypothetical protein